MMHLAESLSPFWDALEKHLASTCTAQDVWLLLKQRKEAQIEDDEEPLPSMVDMEKIAKAKNWPTNV